MQQLTYSYETIGLGRYIFVSTGKKIIIKVVEFTPAKHGDIVNLGFGDLLPDGTLDDKVISNNGDIIKIFSTVISIVREFSNRFPHLKIAFAGSTPQRTKLYGRTLKMYYPDFSKEFKITALVERAQTAVEVDFDPAFRGNYVFYFIEKI